MGVPDFGPDPRRIIRQNGAKPAPARGTVATGVVDDPAVVAPGRRPTADPRLAPLPNQEVIDNMPRLGELIPHLDQSSEMWKGLNSEQRSTIIKAYRQKVEANRSSNKRAYAAAQDRGTKQGTDQASAMAAAVTGGDYRGPVADYRRDKQVRSAPVQWQAPNNWLGRRIKDLQGTATGDLADLATGGMVDIDTSQVQSQDGILETPTRWATQLGGGLAPFIGGAGLARGAIAKLAPGMMSGAPMAAEMLQGAGGAFMGSAPTNVNAARMGQMGLGEAAIRTGIDTLGGAALAPLGAAAAGPGLRRAIGRNALQGMATVVLPAFAKGDVSPYDVAAATNGDAAAQQRLSSLGQQAALGVATGAAFDRMTGQQGRIADPYRPGGRMDRNEAMRMRGMLEGHDVNVDLNNLSHPGGSSDPTLTAEFRQGLNQANWLSSAARMEKLQNELKAVESASRQARAISHPTLPAIEARRTEILREMNAIQGRPRPDRNPGATSRNIAWNGAPESLGGIIRSGGTPDYVNRVNDIKQQQAHQEQKNQIRANRANSAFMARQLAPDTKLPDLGQSLDPMASAVPEKAQPTPQRATAPDTHAGFTVGDVMEVAPTGRGSKVGRDGDLLSIDAVSPDLDHVSVNGRWVPAPEMRAMVNRGEIRHTERPLDAVSQPVRQPGPPRPAPQVQPEQGVVNPPHLPVPEATRKQPATIQPDPLKERNNLLLQKSAIEAALATGRLSKTDLLNAQRALNKVNKQLTTTVPVPQAPALDSPAPATLTRGEAEARAAARAVQGNPVHPLPNDVPRPEIPDVVPEPAPAAKAPKARKPKTVNNPPAPPVVDVPEVKAAPAPASVPTKAKPKSKAPAKAEVKAEATGSYSVGDHFKDADGNIYKVTAVDNGGTVTAKLRRTKVSTLQAMVGKEVDFDPDMQTGLSKVDVVDDTPTTRKAGEMKPVKGGRRSANSQSGFIDPSATFEAAWKASHKLGEGVHKVVDKVVKPFGLEVKRHDDGQVSLSYTGKMSPTVRAGVERSSNLAKAAMAVVRNLAGKAADTPFVRFMAETFGPLAGGIKETAVKVGQALNRAFNPNLYKHGKASEYHDMASAEVAEKAVEVKRIAEQMLTAANKAGAEDFQRALYRVLEKSATSGEAAQYAEVQKLAPEARKALMDLTDSLVAAEFLHPDTAGPLRETYLSRLYGDIKANESATEQAFTHMRKVNKAFTNVLKSRGKWIRANEVLGPRAVANMVQVGTSGRGNPIYDVPGQGHMEMREPGMLWRDYTKAERLKMGENENGTAAFIDTFTKGLTNLRTFRTYDLISQDASVARKLEGMAPEQRAKLEADGWTVVDSKKIGKSRTEQYGKLAGHLVAPDVKQFLTSTDYMMGRGAMGAFLKAAQPLMRLWKETKTVWNVRSHLNNMMSNVLLYDLHDGSYQHLHTALKAVVAGKGDTKTMALLEKARALGVFRHDFATSELKDMAASAFDFDIKTGNPSSSLGNMAKFLSKSRQTMINAYGKEDDIFRFALFLDRMHDGHGDATRAAKAAKDGFVNYDIKAPGLIVARNTVTPFISYAIGAYPMVAKAYATKPWKVMKHGAFLAAVHMLGSGLNDAMSPKGSSTEAEERAAAGQGLLDRITTVRTPFRDEQGRSVYHDLTRWHPLAGADDINYKPAVPVPQVVSPGGPYVEAARMTMGNEDPFLTYNGRPKQIRNPDTPVSRQVADVASYAGRVMEPGYMYQGRKFVKSLYGMPDRFGNKLSPGTSAASMLFATKTLDPKEQVAMESRKAEGADRAAQAVIADAEKQYLNNDISRDDYRARVKEQNEISQEVWRKFRDYARTYKEARKGAHK